MSLAVKNREVDYPTVKGPNGKKDSRIKMATIHQAFRESSSHQGSPAVVSAGRPTFTEETDDIKETTEADISF